MGNEIIQSKLVKTILNSVKLFLWGPAELCDVLFSDGLSCR